MKYSFDAASSASTAFTSSRGACTTITSYASVPLFFFFSSRRRHTRFDCDWSSDVCSSDLFRREARAVAQMSHPNIVTVIDRGEDDGQQYIVFELVDGENLKQMVERRGPLDRKSVV